MKLQPKIKPETSNRITANIIRILTMQGAFVTRINTTGIWDKDAVSKKTGKVGLFRTSQMRKGTPDIIACYKGRFISIEVKAGKDRQSIEQVQVQQEIERAKGVYLICRTTDDFVNWFKKQNQPEQPKMGVKYWHPSDPSL